MKKYTKSLPIRLSKGGKITLAVVVFIIAALAFGVLFTESLADIAKTQLKAIKNGDIESAYAMTSSAFQEETSLDQFRSFVSKFPILSTYKSIHLTEERIDDGMGYLIGKLVGPDGNETTIEFQLAKAGRQWKIQAIRLSLGPDQSSADSAGAAIQQIFVNDTADKNGYTQETKESLSRSAKKIYATIQISTPTPGITVYATLTYLPTNGKIGPSSGDISKSGNLLKAFSFTRDQNLWPVGEYQVDATLSTGATGSIRFAVK
jgi:hypothetical protein